MTHGSRVYSHTHFPFLLFVPTPYFPFISQLCVSLHYTPTGDTCTRDLGLWHVCLSLSCFWSSNYLCVHIPFRKLYYINSAIHTPQAMGDQPVRAWAGRRSALSHGAPWMCSVWMPLLVPTHHHCPKCAVQVRVAPPICAPCTMQIRVPLVGPSRACGTWEDRSCCWSLLRAWGQALYNLVRVRRRQCVHVGLWVVAVRTDGSIALVTVLLEPSVEADETRCCEFVSGNSPFASWRCQLSSRPCEWSDWCLYGPALVDVS